MKLYVIAGHGQGDPGACANGYSEAERVRALLDYVAAAKFLLGGSWDEMRAVFRARRAFRRMRPDVEPDRRANLAAAVGGPIEGRMDGSLLVAYYLRGKKTFAQLFARS